MPPPKPSSCRPCASGAPIAAASCASDGTEPPAGGASSSSALLVPPRQRLAANEERARAPRVCGAHARPQRARCAARPGGALKRIGEGCRRGGRRRGAARRGGCRAFRRTTNTHTALLQQCPRDAVPPPRGISGRSGRCSSCEARAQLAARQEATVPLPGASTRTHRAGWRGSPPRQARRPPRRRRCAACCSRGARTAR